MENQQTSDYDRKLTAVLFADVQGYSRLIGEDEAGMHQETSSCLDLFKANISDFRGRIVRIAGDGLLAEIPSAIDAVKFAIAIQKALSERNRDRPVEKRVEFRVGINLGDVIADRGDVFGETVNIASRLESLAFPGGICITQAVYDQVKSKMGCGFEYMGRQDLKNILEPVEVYRVRENPEGMVTLPVFRRESEEKAVPALPSVAVLPFKNLGDDNTGRYLSDGVTEDITVALSRFRELFVISRHSAFVYKLRQHNLQDIGRELGVRYLVEGSIRLQGSRLRLAVRLIEAASGHQVWGERYDHFIDEVFDVMDELTVQIVSTLAVQIQSAERRRMVQAKPDSLEAYGLVLRGQELLILHEQAANAVARQHYERAVELDPAYARAYAAISRTLNFDWRYSWSRDAGRSLDRALEFANKAIQFDEFDARGYSELGFVQIYKKEHNASIAAYNRSIDLNPNDADVLAEMGDVLVHCGENERAVELLSRAMRLNPYYPDWYLWYLAGAHYQMHDYEKAIEFVNKMSNPAEGRRVLAASYAQLGKMDDAKQQALQVMEVHPNFSLAHWAEVQPDKNPEDVEHFIEGLRKAGLK